MWGWFGGGGACNVFLTFYAISNISRKKNLERDSWNLYPLYPLFPCSDFVSQMWGWFGGGGGCVMFFSHFMLFPTKNLEYKTIISHLMFSSCFFLCWKYCKLPLHLQLLVKWEVVSPNSRYREFYHEIGNIEKCPFTYWLNGRWFLQIVDIHVGNFNMMLTGRWFPQIVDRDSGNLYPIYI